MEFEKKSAEKLFEKFGRSYSGGEMIFQEEDPCQEVFMILEGRVRLIKRVRHIERDIVVLKKGDMFGEHAMLDSQLQPASAVSLGSCRVLAFQVADFQALLRSQPEIGLKLIGQLVRRLQAAEDRIENMMLRDSQSKIVNTLIRLAQHEAPGATQVVLAITPIELSSKIGLDVDSVKRGILQLKEHKYLDIVDEQLELYDVEALRKLYQLMGMKEELNKK
ncbi:MAG: Crp/Fnr family transcriptional regulator [Deltaproteobacteria bacterium]|nr:Crp/Fnr family transcriptional regulator [Deltaproteobacteria bacterium]